MMFKYGDYLTFTWKQNSEYQCTGNLIFSSVGVLTLHLQYIN